MAYTDEERLIAITEATLGEFGRRNRKIRRLLRRASRARRAGTRDADTEDALVDAVTDWTVRLVMES
jgi:hypothetical protein